MCSTDGIRDRRARRRQAATPARPERRIPCARGRLASRALPHEVEDDRQAGDGDDRGEGLGGVAQCVDREEDEHDRRSPPIAGRTIARARADLAPAAGSRRCRRGGRSPASTRCRPRRSRRGRRGSRSRGRAPAVISRPACGPSREPRPKNGGNCPTSASIAVSPPDGVERRVDRGRGGEQRRDRHHREAGVAERGARRLGDRGLAVADRLGRP